MNTIASESVVQRIAVHTCFLVDMTVVDIRNLTIGDDDTFLRDRDRVDGQEEGHKTVFILRGVGVFACVGDLTSEEIEVLALANLFIPGELTGALRIHHYMINTIASVDRTQRVVINSRLRDIATMDLQCLAFSDLIFLPDEVRRMDIDDQLINAVKAVRRQDTIRVLAGRSDRVAMPFIGQVDAIRLTQINGIREEVRGVNGQDEVLQTIAALRGLTRPFIGTRIRQLAVVEDIGLFIRYMLLEDLIVRRVLRDDIFDNGVTADRGRDRIVELTAIVVLSSVEEEGVSGADGYITLAIERLIDGQVQRFHYAR